LNVIHDDLTHGAELGYTEDLGMDEPTIQRWLCPKEQLGVFRPITPSTGPNYSSGEIMEEVARLIAAPPPDEGSSL
jgi:hypothetical protein